MAISKQWQMPSPKARARRARKVDVKRVPETVPAEIAKAHHFKLDQAAPIATSMISPTTTRSSSEPGPASAASLRRWRAFLDQAGSLWMRGALHGKVGGAFSSSGTQHGGQEMTLFSIIANLMHFGMVIVGLDYGHTGQMTLDEITGGAPYGATTIAGADGSRQPSCQRIAGRALSGPAHR